jgi:hypothetical protein
MMKTMRINHKMPTMNRITPSDLLVSQILNGMIPLCFPSRSGADRSVTPARICLGSYD